MQEAQDRIKPNEVRIGNFIWLKSHHHPVQVEEIFKEHDNSIWVATDLHEGERIEDYEPIPLSEDWLIRFGFKWLGADHYENISKYRIDSIAGKYFFCSPMIHSSKFQYVHQLQNLYFALTGTELQTAISGINQKG